MFGAAGWDLAIDKFSIQVHILLMKLQYSRTEFLIFTLPTTYYRPTVRKCAKTDYIRKANFVAATSALFLPKPEALTSRYT
jgi:hypothetical protein